MPCYGIHNQNILGVCLFLDRNTFPEVSLSIFNYSSLNPCFSLSVCMRKITWANRRNYLPWRATKLCNNSNHKTWLDNMAQPCLHLQESTKSLPLVCGHCHPRSVNDKERSSRWRISILIDAYMWKYLQNHISAICQNNPDCTSEHRSLYHCMNMHRALMHRLQTYLPHSHLDEVIQPFRGNPEERWVLESRCCNWHYMKENQQIVTVT